MIRYVGGSLNIRQIPNQPKLEQTNKIEVRKLLSKTSLSKLKGYWPIRSQMKDWETVIREDVHWLKNVKAWVET